MEREQQAKRQKEERGGEGELFAIEQFLQAASQTIVDIYSRYLFERAAFERIADGAVTADDCASMILDAQKRAYGDTLSEWHPYMWAVKSHYYDAEFSFYNYPYAFGLLFALSLLIVFRVFPYYWGLLAVVVALLALDFRALLHVDYSLLLTFCAFFIFSGNLARIPAVAETLSAFVAFDPLAVGVLSCQVISNVPTSVLLSKFTENYPALLIAVNAGGLGTPIASLASLITLNTFRRMCPGETGRYLIRFLLYNFSFLAVLIGTGYLTLLFF